MKADNPAMSGGFTQIPNSFFDAPVSPLAKMVLFYLCKFANDRGRSYYKLKDIGALIGRSKASVSNCLAELREAGYIHCIRQKNRMGYNISLEVIVKGWADIKAYWKKLSKDAAKKRAEEAQAKKAATQVAAPCAVPQAPSTPVVDPAYEDPSEPNEIATPKQPISNTQKTERPVQHVERKDPKGLINNIHKNNTTGAGAPLVWSKENEASWKLFRPSESDPVTVTHKEPSPELLHHAIACADRLEQKSSLPSRDQMRSAAFDEIAAFVQQRRLAANAEQVEEVVGVVLNHAHTPAALRTAMQALNDTWQPHWRKLSNPTQIKDLLKEICSHEGISKEEMVNLLKWRTRARAARLWLRMKNISQRSILAPSMPLERTKYHQSHLEAVAA